MSAGERRPYRKADTARGYGADEAQSDALVIPDRFDVAAGAMARRRSAPIWSLPSAAARSTSSGSWRAKSTSGPRRSGQAAYPWIEVDGSVQSLTLDFTSGVIPGRREGRSPKRRARNPYSRAVVMDSGLPRWRAPHSGHGMTEVTARVSILAFVAATSSPGSHERSRSDRTDLTSQRR